MDKTTLLAVDIMVVVFCLMIYCQNTFFPFLANRDYVKREMERSDGREYLYWKREWTRLHLSLIPVIGRRLAKRYQRKKRKKE